MPLIMGNDASDVRLRTAIVLLTTEDSCTVFAEGRRADVSYARQFPGPRS